MRKLTSYEVTAIVHQSNEVRSATCPCPGGVNPACCKHTFAVLSAIEDYSRRELFCATTEKLQAWHKPKVTKVSPKKYSETMGARGTDSQKFAASTAVNMQALSGLHQTMPIFSVLTGSDTSLLSDEIFYDKTITLPVSSAKSAQQINVPVPEFLDMDVVMFYHQRVQKTLEELQRLERQTMSQSTLLWHQEREIRVTAYRTHEIINSSNMHAICENLLTKKDLSQIAPIQLGKRLEPMMKNMLKADYKNYIFRNTGLIVHPDFPFLGASPDGLLYKTDGLMIIEIKTIYNPRHMSLDQLIDQRRDFCISLQHSSATGIKSYSLKHNHKYYTQIQMQLFCSGIDKCLFLLFYDYDKSILKEIIVKDNAFFNSTKLNVLSHFYFSVYLPYFSVYLPRYIAIQARS